MRSWLLLVLTTTLVALVLAIAAVYAYRVDLIAQTQAPDTTPTLEQRVRLLEKEVERLKNDNTARDSQPHPLADYNEVYINGHFSHLRKRDPAEFLWPASGPYHERKADGTGIQAPAPIIPPYGAR